MTMKRAVILLLIVLLLNDAGCAAQEERFGLSLPELSMGMSGDYVQAIEEGATMIRVGTEIFGPRIVKA